MNQIFLVGHLGKDPEMAYTPGGLAVTKFSLATTYGKKGQDGNFTKETTWHNCVTFGSTAENCNNFLRKGSKVSLRGRATNRKYTGKDGIERNWHEIVVEEIDFPPKTGGSTEDFTPPEIDYDQPF